MSIPAQNRADFYLKKGLRELARHNPASALGYLQQAVEAIPPSCADRLSSALYWLSIALFRLDRRELAIRSLSNAQKLRRQSYARSMYLRNINEYGMTKRPTPELDDLYAFVSIQLGSYLSKKQSRRFSSEAEHATIMKLILEAWDELRSSGAMDALECGEKLQLFRKVKIEFPLFGTEYAAPRARARNAAFFAQDYSAPCACASGLPYSQCCGRTHGLQEL